MTKKKNKVKKLPTVLVVVLILVLGLSVTASAFTGDFLDKVAKYLGETAGRILGNSLAEQVNISEEEGIGGASSVGVTQSTFKIAQQAMNNATRTPVSMLNNSGQDRVITNVKTWWEASQSATDDDVPVGVNGGNGGPLGTAGGASQSTLLLGASTSTTAFATSSDWFLMSVQVFATSTSGVLTPQITDNDSPTGLTSAATRLWLDGEYLNFVWAGATPTQSTSTGLIVVEYVVR